MLLGAVLEDYPDALEYDLQRLGIDLMDFWRGTLSVRKIIALAWYLPEDSAVVSELRAEQTGADAALFRSWTTAVEMTANVVDAVVNNTASRAQMNTKKKLKAPEPISRPGQSKKDRPKNARVMSVSELKRRQKNQRQIGN